jgi:hypothetical protein
MPCIQRMSIQSLGADCHCRDASSWTMQGNGSTTASPTPRAERSGAHYALGMLRRVQNRLAEARIEFETTIALDRAPRAPGGHDRENDETDHLREPAAARDLQCIFVPEAARDRSRGVDRPRASTKRAVLIGTLSRTRQRRKGPPLLANTNLFSVSWQNRLDFTHPYTHPKRPNMGELWRTKMPPASG